MSEDRSGWVTKVQLDMPLCNVFEGMITNGTAREYVVMCESILKKGFVKLEKMTYEGMNRYIDSLSLLIDKFA